VDGVRVAYGAKQVLAGVTFTLGPGLTYLVGRNGAGKTTLIETMTGDRRPDAGAVESHGVRIGYLPQIMGYPPAFTLRQFLEYLGWLKGMSAKDVRAEAERVAEVVHLAPFLAARMGTLSGGELRRAGVAQALLDSPPVLFLDEPASGLDPAQRWSLAQVLGELASTHAVVVSTHILADVAVDDRLLVLHDGQIRFEGSGDDLTAIGAAESGRGSDMERGFMDVTAGDGL
jgi:ABC-2 type transport system ATP-binding protein